MSFLQSSTGTVRSAPPRRPFGPGKRVVRWLPAPPVEYLCSLYDWSMFPHKLLTTSLSTAVHTRTASAQWTGTACRDPRPAPNGTGRMER